MEEAEKTRLLEIIRNMMRKAEQAKPDHPDAKRITDAMNQIGLDHQSTIDSLQEIDPTVVDDQTGWTTAFTTGQVCDPDVLSWVSAVEGLEAMEILIKDLTDPRHLVLDLSAMLATKFETGVLVGYYLAKGEEK